MDEHLVPEILDTAVRQVRKPGKLVEFSKTRFYFLLHGIFVAVVLLIQSPWLFSTSIMAGCYVNKMTTEPYKLSTRRGNTNIKNSGTLMLSYKVDGKLYQDYVTRNEVPLSQDSIQIRYLTFLPSVCRLNSFEGNYLGFIISWILFFVFTTMVFFIPNDTMPKNSFIYFSRQKPFIHMIVK